MTQTTTTIRDRMRATLEHIAERRAIISRRIDERLIRAAMRRNPRVAGWWGHSGSTGCIRRYVCYVCRHVVDTDAAKWGPTQHAAAALAAHRAVHEPRLAAQLVALEAVRVQIAAVRDCAEELRAQAERRARAAEHRAQAAEYRRAERARRESRGGWAGEALRIVGRVIASALLAEWQQSPQGLRLRGALAEAQRPDADVRWLGQEEEDEGTRRLDAGGGGQEVRDG